MYLKCFSDTRGTLLNIRLRPNAFYVLEYKTELVQKTFCCPHEFHV